MMYQALRRREIRYEKPVGGLYNSLSEDSIVYPKNQFSNWFGNLALVQTTTSDDPTDITKLDPIKIARRYSKAL